MEIQSPANNSLTDKAIGATSLAAGGYVGYQGVNHGLPRALGIRTEYHITSKENAKAIKASGGFLDPKFGGYGGWSEKTECIAYILTSKDNVHITGKHSSVKADSLYLSNVFKKIPQKINDIILPTIARQENALMYRLVGRNRLNEHLSAFKNKLALLRCIIKDKLLPQTTKTLFIAGIDSYFDTHFEADFFANASLISKEKVKVHSNRLSAMLHGLKEFGLKGMKENKGRVAFGAAILTICSCISAKLINYGRKKLS